MAGTLPSTENGVTEDGVSPTHEKTGDLEELISNMEVKWILNSLQ